MGMAMTVAASAVCAICGGELRGEPPVCRKCGAGPGRAPVHMLYRANLGFWIFGGLPLLGFCVTVAAVVLLGSRESAVPMVHAAGLVVLSVALLYCLLTRRRFMRWVMVGAYVLGVIAMGVRAASAGDVQAVSRAIAVMVWCLCGVAYFALSKRVKPSFIERAGVVGYFTWGGILVYAVIALVGLAKRM